MCSVQCVQCQMKCHNWKVSHCPRYSWCFEVNMVAATYLPGHCKTHLMKYEKCVCVCSKNKQWRVCGHTGRTQLTQLFFPHWRNTNRVLAPHLNIGVQLKGASVARWILWFFVCTLRRDDWIYNGWWHVFLLIELMSRNLSEARAQLALDQRQPHLLFWRAIKCCWLPLLHFVDLPPEPLFAHRQNSSEAPEITITAHTRSRSTLSEPLWAWADQKFLFMQLGNIGY